ncbi:MAG: monofunctional biosynthetic peptidoglycan transglycosylase [Pseudomonadota bacterium]
MARNAQLLRIFGTAARWGARILLLLLLLLVVLIVTFRFVNPISTLMLGRMLLHEKVDQKSISLDHVSEALRAAVITSEDAHFCHHHGVDWGAMREVIDESGIDGPSRGASTITMQVAKNVFLWPGHSYIRKALEIPLALVLDFVWPKRRILEVYLNVAEWGDGIFGAEAAANFYFHEPAADLTLRQAALMAAVLPDPHRRNVLSPNRHVLIHARVVEDRVQAGETNLACVR